MKNRYKIIIIFVFALFLFILSDDGINAVRTVTGDTAFEEFGRYSIAVAGNNNAKRASYFEGPDEELILSYPENWDLNPSYNEKIEYNNFNYTNYENEIINIYPNWRRKNVA